MIDWAGDGDAVEATGRAGRGKGKEREGVRKREEAREGRKDEAQHFGEGRAHDVRRGERWEREVGNLRRDLKTGIERADMVRFPEEMVVGSLLYLRSKLRPASSSFPPFASRAPLQKRSTIFLCFLLEDFSCFQRKEKEERTNK